MTKAQMKIQEMAFVLLALALLAGLVLIFVIRFQSEDITKAGQEVKQAEAVSLLERISSLPELNCQKSEICIDEDKAVFISQNQDKVRNLFQNIKKAQIRRVYPEGETINLYQFGQANQSYSTFISICKLDKIGSAFEWSCGIGQLELGV
jgi:hypothetical protein